MKAVREISINIIIWEILNDSWFQRLSNKNNTGI